ncbi:DUF3275 family protein [Alicycliphilus denitrificans]|uniref:DUF3275 family protein n=1 Tax=Alicycliphilus denitrificans TaxID=179636 RepID=UPI0038507182
MIKLSGVTLRVKKIRGGRNGFFCIGELLTDIGEFRVVDPLLDQFEDGDYTGTVWVERIFLKQYIYYGKGITEIRATLHDVQLDSAAERPDDRMPPEADPAEELPASYPAATPTLAPRPTVQPPPALTDQLREQLKAKLANAKQVRASSSQADRAQPATSVPAPATPPPAENSALAELFAELWPQVQHREPVKLDSTVDRARLRQQVSALKDLGYSIDPMSQTWLPI